MKTRSKETTQQFNHHKIANRRFVVVHLKLICASKRDLFNCDMAWEIAFNCSMFVVRLQPLKWSTIKMNQEMKYNDRTWIMICTFFSLFFIVASNVEFFFARIKYQIMRWAAIGYASVHDFLIEYFLLQSSWVLGLLKIGNCPSVIGIDDGKWRRPIETENVIVLKWKYSMKLDFISTN